MAGRRTSLQPPPTFKLLRKEEPSGSSASGHLGLAKRRRKRKKKRAQKHSPLQNKMKEERETRNKDVANEVKRKRQKRKQKEAPSSSVFERSGWWINSGWPQKKENVADKLNQGYGNLLQHELICLPLCVCVRAFNTNIISVKICQNNRRRRQNADGQLLLPVSSI